MELGPAPGAAQGFPAQGGPPAAAGAPELVCVDFDDTLVASQEHFARAAEALNHLLQRECGLKSAAAHAIFRRCDAAHHHLGRHRNRFLATLVAAYAEAAGREEVPLRLLHELAAIAATPYDAPVTPLPGVAPALRRLRRHCPRVALVTAGDAVVQAGRIQRSGLAALFSETHVVPEKTPAVFAALGRGHRRCVMIGNAPRADLWPALAAGFEAVHVQAPTWELDDAPLPPGVPSCPSFAAAVDLLLGGPAGAGGTEGAPGLRTRGPQPATGAWGTGSA